MTMTPDAPSTPALIAVEDVHKRYASGTYALRGVSMAVRPGSVHGLVGANGAGKSTLIKILCGAQGANAGNMRWKGAVVDWSAPAQALAAGMATVQQNTPLVPTLSVLDNVYLARKESPRWDAVARRVQLTELSERMGYAIDPDATVADLAVGPRQMVAIMAALSRNPDVVLLDEPTAALSPTERDVLFRAIRRLRDDGTTFVYVSHFLDEVMDLTDHLTVLRDGRVVLDSPTAQISQSDLVTAIVGERLARMEKTTRPADRAVGEPLLQVRHLASGTKFGPVDLTVHAGEVVGIAGLLGSGRTELLEAIYGADGAASGERLLAGKPLGATPRSAVAAGLALVPEDRAKQGFLRDWEIWRNLSLPYLRSLSWRGMVPIRSREEALADRAIDDLGIKAESRDMIVGELSGGNAQKVVFAKWLYGPTRVILLDQPSAGVDVGVKAEIIQLVRSLADQGRGVVIVTSEFEELLTSCDRILVMRRGRIVADRPAADTDLHELTALASGL